MSFEDPVRKPVSLGPWGGPGGSRWDDGVYSAVRQVIIVHAGCIDSIQIEYDKKGVSIWSEKHGGNGGHKTDRVKLDYPDEFLTSIHGYYDSLRGLTTFVRSLTLESNRRTYGPFGVEEGTHFSFPMNGGKIVGFHGRVGWYLDAIGVYYKPLEKQNPPKSLFHSHNFIPNGNENIGYSVIQGSVGHKYDIVVAVRQKDDLNDSQPNKVSGKVSFPQELITPAPKKTSVKISELEEPKDEVKKEKATSVEKVPSKPEGISTFGPWGGMGGTIVDDGTFTGIKQINLSRNVGIVWIRALYDQKGELLWGSKIGGTGGFKTDKIFFDYPSEILTHVTGYYGPVMYMGPNVIRSLTFHTNKGVHGPYGEEQGTLFSTKRKDAKIVGIYGRKGLFLDAFGVHVLEGKVAPAAMAVAAAPCTAIIPREPVAEVDYPRWSTKLALAKRGPVEEVTSGVVKEPSPCGPGPWGGDGGRPWDDGVFTGIKQIFLTKLATEIICSIQIEYDRNGQSVWSIKHGSDGGSVTKRIKLEYPHEVLTCISGYYGPIGRDDHAKVIKSLTFYTSRGKYGPYGEEKGTFFTSTTTEGKVVGFHGRSSSYLDAIGVHMQHWLGNQKTSKSSLFKLF